MSKDWVFAVVAAIAIVVGVFFIQILFTILAAAIVPLAIIGGVALMIWFGIQIARDEDPDDYPDDRGPGT